MAVRFSTSEFEFSHGRKPRGEGMWAFTWGGEVHFCPGTKTLTEAKAWALREARAAGATVVAVAP